MNDRTIRILDDGTARRIAAGEVIDRPAAVVRELIDNSIDAEATEIEVRIEGGGVKNIRVIDDGFGMPPDDLERSILPHATSKIRTLDDLERIESLGFRGEALSSIAACSRLTIVSKVADSDSAYKLSVYSGKIDSVQPAPGRDGTMTEVADLFYSLPARRKFIRSLSSESAACRSVFTDKALPFPTISFSFFSGGSQKSFFPAGSLYDRVAAAFRSVGNKQMWREDTFELSEGGGRIVYQIPSVTRPDRRYMRVFLNKRRIDEFSLIKSMELAFADCMPGGRFPIALLFLEIPSHLVDFNIHPAKREARIRDAEDIRHSLRISLREILSPHRTQPRPFHRGFVDESQSEITGLHENVYHSTAANCSYFDGHPNRSSSDSNTEYSTADTNSTSRPPVRSADNIDWNKTISNVRERQHFTAEQHAQLPVSSGDDLRFLGRFSDLFIIVARGETLFIIDQHAAHERILYDTLCNSAVKVQELLVPLEFSVSLENDDRLSELQNGLEKLGIRIEKTSIGEWQITGLASGFDGVEDSIILFLQEQNSEIEDLEKTLFSELACKAAIKDGEHLDDISALSLARETMQLPEPRCPHGRPVWFSLSRDEIRAFVGRT